MTSDLGVKMQSFGVKSLTTKCCEYCERDGVYRAFETLCHGVHVCVDHIEAAQTDWHHQVEGER